MIVFRYGMCAMLLAAAAIGANAQLDRVTAAPVSGSQRAPSNRWAYELQRALAHQRMENTMYASTTRTGASGPMCPALVNVGRSRPIAVDLRGAWSKADSRDAPFSKEMGPESDSDSDSGEESESETALDFLLNHISEPIVQAKCVNCHVEGGVSGHTRLILHPSSTPDHGTLNLAVFENFLADVEDGGRLILNKIQGVSHGGGIQVAAGSDDFSNMETFLGLLGYGEDSGPDLSPETLFDTVTMASPGKTLWRAALIFGGRIPTREEREAVDNGTEEDLRAAIRNLMTGPGFHEFLIRASNDRLLTDRHLRFVIDANEPRFVDFVNLKRAKTAAAIEKGHSDPDKDPDLIRWKTNVQFGFARAPLELIAYVVESNLPYTEILTADYIMANPMASEGYGATTQFDDSEDPLEFRPSEIVSYYRDDDSKIYEWDLILGTRVLDPGNLSTDYPHGGILNTTVFLKRYPTTPTNRNRARARWTYYHFLGLDIEKSASRTTDPDALADTDNPTMKNPACTVCHSVMDPVAGTFQNYGETGEYRDEWGGQDSLDGLYKDPEDGTYTPYQPGDSWYRDMRDPGFDKRVAPDADNSVQWLADQIVDDDRFAEATVKFWWPTVTGIEIATPPEDENNSDFEAMLLTSNAQIAEVQRLANAFRTGITDGSPYNLKDLLVEIVLSPWIRGESISDDDPARAAALRNAGVERLLTPEELARKTEVITGYGWRRSINAFVDTNGFVNGNLTDEGRYRLLYGGIDSDGITERADDMTALMAAVAQSHAVEVSCPIVQREFLLWPDENRRLFGGIDDTVSPFSEMSGTAVIEADSWSERETNSWPISLNAGPKTVRLRIPNNFWNPETRVTRNLIVDEFVVRDGTGAVVARVELETVAPVDLDTDSPTVQGGCDGWPYYNRASQRHDGYELNYCPGWLDVPVSIPADGNYHIDVVAFQKAAGDEHAILEIMIESDADTSRGAMAIRSKLVELHEKLLGVTVTVDSPEVEAAFQLFVEVWDRKRSDNDWRDEEIQCSINDDFYFEEIADDVLHEYTMVDQDYWDRADEILDEADWWGQGRQNPIVRTWVVVLAYFMTDYRYLFL